MKLEIDKIEISEDKVNAILKLTGDIREINGWQLASEAESKLIQYFTQKVITERTAEILGQISNNQIINAVIMNVASGLSGRGRQ